MKLIADPKNAPQLRTIGPIVHVAVCHWPPGMNGVIMGIIMLSTNDLTNVVAATPIIKATASPIILYSFRNSLNSEKICFILLVCFRSFYTFLIVGLIVGVFDGVLNGRFIDAAGVFKQLFAFFRAFVFVGATRAFGARPYRGKFFDKYVKNKVKKKNKIRKTRFISCSFS